MLEKSTHEQIIAEITGAPGVVMLVGSTDVGKTALALDICRAGVAAGLSTAVVDADIGQSEVGPPTAIGFGLVEDSLQHFSSVKAKRIYFVGSTSPPGHFVECVTGARKMVDEARKTEADLIVLDTTGMALGVAGRRLKQRKIEAVCPDYLVGVQKNREMEPVCGLYTHNPNINVRLVPATEHVVEKSVEVRTARRQASFRSYFGDAMGHIIKLDAVTIDGSLMGSGRRVKWQYLKKIEDALGCRALHVEVTGQGIYIVSEYGCGEKNYEKLSELFSGRALQVVDAQMFEGMLVGLADETGRTISLGVVQAMDFANRFAYVLSPIRTITPVRTLVFGSLRISPDGSEKGKIARGSL